MMTTVYVKEINQDNWKQAIRIDVAPEQRRFVASNLYSIAESKFNPTFVPLAIYDDSETMVGFLMYGIDNGELWVLRLMVARQFQRRGYGRAAMEEIIRRLKAKPDCREVFTSYKPDNDVAARLYQSLGFEDTGRIEDGELVVRLSLAKQI
jgi:diamine N-acetyltransferase